MNFFKPNKNDDTDIIKDEGKDINSADEAAYIGTVNNDQLMAEGGSRVDSEAYWSDEYLCFKGDQWDLSIAPRSLRKKSKRPNVVNNVSLPTVMNIVDSLTASTPEIKVRQVEKQDAEVVTKLNDVIPTVLDRNDFPKFYRDTTLQMVKHGPLIGYVSWDANFIGGSGPNKWVGEVRIEYIRKEEIFFDPAITDLTRQLQDCRFVHLRLRKSLDYFKERWEERGKYVAEDFTKLTDDVEIDEGFDPRQANLIIRFHKGTPKFLSKEDKERFKELAEEERGKGHSHNAKEYEDKAAGKLKGVHCSLSTRNVFLEYIPYVYDDGLYPIAYEVLYQDEFNPYGFGELRNIMNPQVMYNKLAEIEMESFAVEGLGGHFVRVGAMSQRQMDEFNLNAYMGGYNQFVNDPNGIKKREGTQTPQGLIMAKDFFKRNIDTISQNTAIMQGESPGANVPFSSIRELGARADVRTKGKIETMKRFMNQIARLVINRIGQFYTDERIYRIRGTKASMIKTLLYEGIEQIVQMPDTQQQLAALIQLFETVKTSDGSATEEYGRFSNSEMKREWTIDGDEVEEYIPDFDIDIEITDERPTNRNYFEQLAMTMYGKAIGPKAFWRTIIEGRFPDIEEILQELKEMANAAMNPQEQGQARTMTAAQQGQQQGERMSNI